MTLPLQHDSDMIETILLILGLVSIMSLSFKVFYAVSALHWVTHVYFKAD